MLLMSSGKKLFGNVLTALLLPSMSVLALFVLISATPATSVAAGNRGTSVSTSISNSVGFKKPQGRSADTSLLSSNKNNNHSAAVAAVVAESLPASESPEPSTLSSVFTWGHVTKYSSVLFDEDIVISGPVVLDVKYPQTENSNSYTIIGILAYNNDDDLDAEYTTGNLGLKVYPVLGGIGYNSTVIRFLLPTEHELHYKLVIQGVDIV